ncbi:MAG: hypothetical protein ACJZ7Z_10040 [Myxococcota bacterium]
MSLEGTDVHVKSPSKAKRRPLRATRFRLRTHEPRWTPAWIRGIGDLRQALPRTALTVLTALSLCAPAWALVLDHDQGQGNIRPPQPDPGWDHVIQHLGGPSAVYLGCRWILTTQHVGVTVLTMGGQWLNPVAETVTPIMNPDGRPTDLVLFQVDRDPGLPALRIPARPARYGQEVTLVGFGSSRGPSLTVDFPERGLLDGFSWKKDQTKRWGTNRVAAGPHYVDVGKEDGRTLAIPLVFDPVDDTEATDQEAAAAFGDSGGAVFADLDPIFPERGTALFGLTFSVSSFAKQPKDSSFYGNITWVADLSHYRNAIMEAIQGTVTEDDTAQTTWAPTCSPVPILGAREPLLKSLDWHWPTLLISTGLLIFALAWRRRSRSL